jgi:hypothetical protein
VLSLKQRRKARGLASVDLKQRVDAVVTDFTTPGMNCADLIGEVSRHRPRLSRDLSTSNLGDLMPASVNHSADDRVSGLQEPVRPAELAARLTAAMAEAIC